MWVTLQNNADWDCFKTPILQEILRTQNLFFEERCALGKSYMCSSKLDVQETNFSFNFRNHLIGRSIAIGRIPAFDLRDLIVLSLEIQTPDRSGGPNKQSQRMINVLNNNIDCVPSNVQFSHQEALLHVVENNKGVTMRHVLRIHRVALDFFFGETLLENVQTKNIRTRTSQLEEGPRDQAP